jgi:serine/threonine-protein kinase
MSLAPPEQDPLIGSIFADRYQVVSRLGKGGMAVVYKANDRLLGREVAVKLLRTDTTADPVAAKRLVREAKAAASLHHPHIITMHDVGERDGKVFVVMEVLVGQPLADLMEAEGAVPVERALAICEQVASALVVAHAAGIVHRDIKPENLFLLNRGVSGDFVKMLDFSIAKLPMQMVSAALTRAGSVFGTPHYMAPEQVEGKSAVPQTDLYALGAVLYELVCGEPPFDGASVIDILLKHVKQPPPHLPSRPRPWPEGLDDLLQRLLAKDPNLRPANAADVQGELARLLAQVKSAAAAERVVAAAEQTLTAAAVDVAQLQAATPAPPVAQQEPASPASSLPDDLPAAPVRRSLADFGEPDEERTMVGVGTAALLRASATTGGPNTPAPKPPAPKPPAPKPPASPPPASSPPAATLPIDDRPHASKAPPPPPGKRAPSPLAAIDGPTASRARPPAPIPAPAADAPSPTPTPLAPSAMAVAQPRPDAAKPLTMPTAQAPTVALPVPPLPAANPAPVEVSEPAPRRRLPFAAWFAIGVAVVVLLAAAIWLSR